MPDRRMPAHCMPAQRRMPAPRWALRVGVLAALLAAGASRGAPLRADGGWWSDLDKGQGVRLADVLESPERHRGRALTFTCVFHQQEREFNPLRTRFNSERYANISVWPDGAALWKPGDFARDFPFLYVARNGPQKDELLRYETFTRLEVTARIEAVVDGSPFLEVLGARVTGHRLGRKVMDYMLRGEVYGRTAGADAQTLAAENFQGALDAAPDLAPVYVTLVRERLAEALRNLGRNDEALRVLAGQSATSGSEEPEATAPNEPSAPTLPRGGSLPGEDVEQPTTSGFPAPRQPTPSGSPAAPSQPPPIPPPSPPVPTYVPGESLRPSLPGVPTDETPPAPRVPSPPQPPLLAPVIVDPPLPSTPPGGRPPVRKPRLAGVK